MIGGIIGIIVDFATGAVYNVDPDEINVPLTKIAAVSEAKPLEAEVQGEKP